AEVPTLVFIGRHRYYKGLDTLIRAMPTLNARLLIGGDGPMRGEWEALARTLGVTGRVQFLGEISDADLPRFFASGDIFVLPANSRAEAFGKVLLEAMATGLPCVTTELGTGTSYAVQDGLTGFVVPPQDPAALGDALRRLLEDAGVRKTMGAAGRARVLAEFTPEKLLERTQKIYREVLDS
ncbi:MAG: glycosyltransferase, partial [Candidatus Omnitrophica bacterium]|nr:glycosyltransferase [Candidatus Omnitrophota bacterium]